MKLQQTRTIRPVAALIAVVCLLRAATLLAKPPGSIGRFQSCLAGHLGLAVLDTCTGQVWDVYTGGVNDPKPIKVDGLPIGRFQWPVSNGNLPGAYVIDSVTGQVWDDKNPKFHEVKLPAPAR